MLCNVVLLRLSVVLMSYYFAVWCSVTSVLNVMNTWTVLFWLQYRTKALFIVTKLPKQSDSDTLIQVVALVIFP